MAGSGEGSRKGLTGPWGLNGACTNACKCLGTEKQKGAGKALGEREGGGWGHAGFGIPAGLPGSASPCKATRESLAAARSVCVLETDRERGGRGGAGPRDAWVSVFFCK